jgi:hypothetical protein
MKGASTKAIFKPMGTFEKSIAAKPFWGGVDACRLFSGPPGAWLGFFRGAKIERRPRGASRAKLAPTFISGQ